MSLADDIQSSLERSPAARRNYQIGVDAVRQTNAVLSEGPENSPLAAAWSTIREWARRPKTAKQVAVQGMRDGFKRDMPSKIIRLSTIAFIAYAAKHIKTGRCGEFAAVTFEHLRQVPGADAVGLEMAACPNHWVVVIARSEGTDLARPSTWNRDAVVADAWSGECYFGTTFSLRRPAPPKVSVRFPGADSDKGNALSIGDWDSW